MFPAASLIIVRDRPDGEPELLMLERSSRMAFAAGALVFPGGRVEHADHALAASLGIGPDDLIDAAARIAAIRETIEESGVAIGLSPIPSLETLAQLRAGLAAGEPLQRLIEDHGLTIDLGSLTAFGRWIPPVDAPRRFDTRFYVAAAPAGALEVPDGGESVRAVWESASRILEGAEQGQFRVIFPTLCNLARLAQFGSCAEAVADAEQHGHHVISPWVETRGEERWLCIGEDRGYPVSALPLSVALRG